MELHIRYEGREITIEEPRPLTVGRDPDADVYVPDERVSRHHAVLQPTSDGWAFEDRGSTNGTFCRGARVESVPVAGLTEVRLGNPDDGPAIQLVALSSGDMKGTVIAGSPGPKSTSPPPTPSPERRRPGAPRLGRMSAINRLVHDLDGPDDDEPTQGHNA